MHDFQGYFSRTFQDLKLQFPGLSRTKVIFQDFPGPGIFKKKKPGLSRRRGNPVYMNFTCTVAVNSIQPHRTASTLHPLVLS